MKKTSRLAALLTRLRPGKAPPLAATTSGETRRYDVAQIASMMREARGDLEAVDAEMRQLKAENGRLRRELEARKAEIALLNLQLLEKR